MTRENKLALVVGFGLILFVGILITDHLAADTRSHEPLPAARIPESRGISLLGRNATPLEQDQDVSPVREVSSEPRVLEIVLDPSSGSTPSPARPLRAIDPNSPRSGGGDALAGRGMATPPPPAERTHVVRRGETLSGIAKSVYGDAALWRLIANANPRVDPKTIRPGTRLTIPAEEPRSLRQVAAREVAPSVRVTSETARRSYTVRSGDSLAGIAARELGAETRWPEIQRINDLTDVTVFPGQTLSLPGR